MLGFFTNDFVTDITGQSFFFGTFVDEDSLRYAQELHFFKAS